MQCIAMPQLHNNMSNCHEKHKGYKNLVSILIHDGLTFKVFNLRKEKKWYQKRNIPRLIPRLGIFIGQRFSFFFNPFTMLPRCKLWMNETQSMIFFNYFKYVLNYFYVWKNLLHNAIFFLLIYFPLLTYVPLFFQ